jgi:hypothetical protein
MFEEYQICPYTGLRSFTEEESLYFKGREEHIEQATEQLQRNKFLMLTGASGDGKSSLVYAGIVPNARAGFLKSKYTQWGVADFRPERTPFKNLCRAVAKQLDIANPQTVESELQHGFSALVDLYKNSKCFVDVDSVSWKQADDAQRAVLKRSAANLIIIVDQFEEFFTNPENYHHGVPSRDSNLVLNVLLETARIALEEDLPIYIVFTMRSDYIGQCAAFRSLPEYIGFSQFFVPRLNRSQLQQVIEEPASLSGNRISRRLTERLIHDIAEGVDQLPILQHALNQIWHAANQGKDEMDLIHYAMVGGMSSTELPDDQVGKFTQWFSKQPDKIKQFYLEANLQNVLDTHANKLYESAAESYRSKTGKALSDEAAKGIIKTAFTCLTKIDQSRAVRNRMTLQEIVNILGKPEFDAAVVGSVLNVFREPGNTFIRPFINESPESFELRGDQVLDITHESLIRNWEYLEEWAKEEFDNYSVSLDFEQQLSRWVKSGKSNGFLLSIGQLTYFENWYNRVNPNSYWIARYLPEDIVQEKKLKRSKVILANAQEFLKRSARKHTVTRTIMRYGPKRIAAVLGILAILMLSSFAVRNYFRQQNEYVLEVMKKQTFELANVKKMSLEFAIPVIAEQLILGNVTIPEAVDAIQDPQQKIRVSTGIAAQLVLQGKNEPKKEILQSLSLADSLLEVDRPKDNSNELSENLKLISDYRVTAGIAYLYSGDKTIELLVKNNARRSARWAMHVFQNQPEDFDDIQFLSLALENGINHKIYTEEEIAQLLKIISPFENANPSTWVKENFHRDKILARGGFTYGLRFNGLYQDLAYLYAATGNADAALKCVDTLLHYKENFYLNDYGSYVENASNIAMVFHTYGKNSVLDDFVSGYCSRKGTNPVDFYYRLVSWALMDYEVSNNTNFYTGGGGQEFNNLNVRLSTDEALSFFYQKLKSEILKIKDADERNFNLAVVYKNEGIVNSYRREIRGEEAGEEVYDNYKKAIAFYQLVSKYYLEKITRVTGVGADVLDVPAKFIFLFPDYRVAFHPFEPRTLVYFYYSGSFIKYALEHQVFDELYRTDDELKFFELWLLDYHMNMSSRDFTMKDPIHQKTLAMLASKMEERNASKVIDINILYMHLGQNAFAVQDSVKGIMYWKKVQPEKLLNAFRYSNFNFVNSYSFELTGKAVAYLSTFGQFEQAYQLINVFKKDVNRSSLYAYASQQVSLNKQSPGVATRLLDSAKAEMNRIENPADFQPNRHQVAMALMYLNPKKNSDEAYRTIKNSFAKFEAVFRFSRAHAFHGNLYEAQQQIPMLVSSADLSGFLQVTMDGLNLASPQKPEWKKFKENEFIFARRFLPYINEDD